MTNPNLPPEFDVLLQIVTVQPEPVRAMWKYALVLVMIDDEKAHVVGAHQDGDTLHLIVQTVAGDRFEVERPRISEEVEQMLLEQIRQEEASSTQMASREWAPSIALVVGNGLTKDLLGKFSELGIDSSRPLSWDFNVPFGSTIPWREAFPELAKQMEISPVPPNEYNLFKALLLENNNNSELETRVREFLRFAYSDLQMQMDPLDKSATAWTSWLRDHARYLDVLISFNYDLLLEDLLGAAGVKVLPYDFESESGILFLKPHGSIDFTQNLIDLKVNGVDTKHAPTVFVGGNDAPLVHIARPHLGEHPLEAYIVLAGEDSPYLHLQWVEEGSRRFVQRAKSITHCIFLGLSYWECDRKELDSILESLSSLAIVIEANPHPNEDFQRKVISLKLRYEHWQNGPQVLPKLSSDQLANKYVGAKITPAALKVVERVTDSKLRTEALDLVAQIREFLSQRDEEDRLSDVEWQQMMSATTEEETRELSHRFSENLIQRSRKFIREYETRFKVDAIILRDELLSRLPQHRTDNRRRGVFYEHPTNPLGVGEVVDDLEFLAKSLR